MKVKSHNTGSVTYDIVLLPAKEQAQKATVLSRELELRGTFFTLDNHDFHAHISLFMVRLKSDDIEEVKARLAAITQTSSPIGLAAARYNQSWGYIDVEYGRSRQAAELQAAVLAAVNPLRDGITEEDSAHLAKATGLKRENLATYGYKSIGELFRPHLTFTRFKDSRSIDTSDLPSPEEFDGIFPQIGVFELGDHGTCVREVARFDLSS